jgi:hypothetical protein
MVATTISLSSAFRLRNMKISSWPAEQFSVRGCIGTFHYFKIYPIALYDRNSDPGKTCELSTKHKEIATCENKRNDICDCYRIDYSKRLQGVWSTVCLGIVKIKTVKKYLTTQSSSRGWGSLDQWELRTKFVVQCYDHLASVDTRSSWAVAYTTVCDCRDITKNNITKNWSERSACDQRSALRWPLF